MDISVMSLLPHGFTYLTRDLSLACIVSCGQYQHGLCKKIKKFERVTWVPQANEKYDVDENKTNKPTAFYDSEPPYVARVTRTLLCVTGYLETQTIPFVFPFLSYQPRYIVLIFQMQFILDKVQQLDRWWATES